MVEDRFDAGSHRVSAAGEARPPMRPATARLWDRINEIVEAAEAAAVEIQADAEAEAARYLQERKREIEERLSERERSMAEALRTAAERSDRARAELDSLMELLESTAERLRSLASAEAQQTPATPRDLLAVPQNNEGLSEIPPEAVIRVTRMDVAGTDRTEMARVLRDEYGITDAAHVIDQILALVGRDAVDSLGTFNGPAGEPQA